MCMYIYIYIYMYTYAYIQEAHDTRQDKFDKDLDLASGPADVADHSGAWLLLFPVWLQLRVRATLRSFLVDLFVAKIKLRERERERLNKCDDTLPEVRIYSMSEWKKNCCNVYRILAF